MPAFRLTQISDTHLARRLPTLTDNFDRIRETIDATRPDLVINSGDLGFDGPTHRDDLEFAKTGCTIRSAGLLPVAICPAITTSVTIQRKSGRLRLNPSPSKAWRLTVPFSAKTAGVSTPRAGVSSGSTHLS